MRKPILETRPGGSRRRDVISIVQAPVGPREDLARELRVGNDRVDRDVREVAGFVTPRKGSAIGRANHLEDMSRRRRSIGVEAAYGCVADGRSRGRRVEGDVQDRAVRQDTVIIGDVDPGGLVRTRSQAATDLDVAVVSAYDRG